MSGEDQKMQDRHEAGGQEGPTGERSLLDELRAVAEEVMGSDNLKRLVGRADEAGIVADLAVASQLDDLRLIEKARFHRARRDAGRAQALGDKPARERAATQVAEVGNALALLRLQRDVSSRRVDVDAADVVSPTKPARAERGEAGATDEPVGGGDRRAATASAEDAGAKKTTTRKAPAAGTAGQRPATKKAPTEKRASKPSD